MGGWLSQRCRGSKGHTYTNGLHFESSLSKLILLGVESWVKNPLENGNDTPITNQECLAYDKLIKVFHLFRWLYISSHNTHKTPSQPRKILFYIHFQSLNETSYLSYVQTAWMCQGEIIPSRELVHWCFPTRAGNSDLIIPTSLLPSN